MNEIPEFNREYNRIFYNSVCHVCKKFNENILRCSNCKLISYCSKEHQKQHWYLHKSICKAANSIMNQKNMKSLFDSAYRKSWMEYIDVKRQIGGWLTEHLKRPLSLHENQLWMFPRLCSICRLAQQNILVDCSKCHCVAYCCKEHENEDRKEHERICGTLKLAFECDQFLITNNFPEVTIKLIPSSSIILPTFTEFIDNFAQVNSKICSLTSILLSDILTIPCTILFVLNQVNWVVKRQSSKTKIFLNIIGVSKLELSLNWTLLFEILHHWIENLSEITLRFIGPECIIEEGISSMDISHTLCHKCRQQQRSCKIYFHKCFYHEYKSQWRQDDVDLNIIFNCGFHEYCDEPANDSWKPTLQYLIEAPVAFTSYTESEGCKDFNLVQPLLNNHRVILKNERNCFSSFRPIRDWEDNVPIFYANQFISIIVPR